MDKIKLNFVNKSTNPDPEFGKTGNSGFDLRAWITGVEPSITIKPLERVLIHTGLYFDIPEGMEIQVRARSGMALKRGLGVLNAPATIDSNYTGEICVIAVNLSNEDIVIENGERIVQGVLCPVYGGWVTDLLKVVEITKNTERGSTGFGHSGIN
jgi:dUTP pyrophosphatase